MTAGFGLQTTLRRPAALAGVGVHSGQVVGIVLRPAPADAGIRFVRRTATGGECSIPALFGSVAATDLCTTLSAHGGSIATVEHLLAALSAMEVDNAIIEADAAELPVMDGSAAPFVRAITDAGVETLPVARTCIRVVRPVRVEMGRSFAELRPYDGRRVEVEIDFDSPVIGRQAYYTDVTPGLFAAELAAARTFGFLADVQKLRERGLALGASMENAIVVGDEQVLNPEGLRFEDEFVRHKAMDAVGDLALAGAPILGCYRSYRGGHRLNVMMLEALFAQRDAWVYAEAPELRESGRTAQAHSAPAFGALAY